MFRKAVSIKLLILLLGFSGWQIVAARVDSAASLRLLSGRVADREGMGISGARIWIERGNQSWSVNGDPQGGFAVSLPDGVYRFTIERSAFKKLVVPDVIVGPDASTNRQFRMEIDCCIDVVNLQPALEPEPQPNISINGYFSSDRAQRGRVLQAAIVMEIPGGYHVNANRPLNKYSIPTTVKVDGENGIRVSPVSYPRAIVRKLKASNNEPLALYEGRAIFRFTISVSANYQGSINLKTHLRYQSCNDEVCFPPRNQDGDMGIDVVGPNDRVQRTNGWVFGRR